MNSNFDIVESLNYDFLPGSPVSRRAWYITLRRPQNQLQRGMFVKFYSKRHPNTLIPDDRIFRVEEVYGRHIIVEPMSDARVGYGNMRLTTNPHQSFMYIHGSRDHHPRMGVQLYNARDPHQSFIEWPVVPAF